VSNMAFVLRFPALCTEGVTRRDEYQPCDKPAVAVRHNPESGEPYPVCARHARADMVPLPDLIAAVRAQVAHLLPAESLALTIALAQIRRGEPVTPNITAMCAITLSRLAKGDS